ncbi:hypothetical protein ACFQYP_00620 [Nonomuraea antimicrobica]
MWVAITGIVGSLTSVPALAISVHALQISERQATATYQQFANHVTQPKKGRFLLPVTWGTNVIIRNSNTVTVSLSGNMQFFQAKPGSPGYTLTSISDHSHRFNVPACTEAEFTVEGRDEISPSGRIDATELRLYTWNTLDGRYWSAPEEGDQAHPVDDREVFPENMIAAWVHDPEKTRKVSPCA